MAMEKRHSEHLALRSAQDAVASQIALDEKQLDTLSAKPHAIDLDHRPSEVHFGLAEVAVREFDAMVLAGREQAEFALMGAGFLGGATTTMIVLWLALSMFGTLALVVTSFIQVQDSPDEDGSSGIMTSGQLLVFFNLGKVGQAAWQCAIFICGLLRAYFLARRMYRRAYWVMVLTLPIMAGGLLLWTLSNVATFTLQPNVIRGYCSPNEDSCSDAAVRRAAITDAFAKIFLGLGCGLIVKGAAALAEERIYVASETTRMIYLAMAISLILQGL